MRAVTCPRFGAAGILPACWPIEQCVHRLEQCNSVESFNAGMMGTQEVGVVILAIERTKFFRRQEGTIGTVSTAFLTSGIVDCLLVVWHSVLVRHTYPFEAACG